MKIAFIGAGKMAEAMVGALIHKGGTPPHHILAIDLAPARLQVMKDQYGVATAAQAEAGVEFATTLVIAVKPQNLDALLPLLGARLTSEHLVLSIAAGKRLAYYEAAWPKARIVRVMPNVACFAGEAMSVYTGGQQVRPGDREIIESLLGCFGRYCSLPESHFDAVTALSGSGPAFIAYLAEAFTQAAVAEGLPADAARLLTAQTLLGTARLLLDNHYASPRELMDAVTSAKGTTAAGREILESSDVTAVIRQTLQAAARRSRELSGSSA